jgi:site-specific DNA-cytosine methylase
MEEAVLLESTWSDAVSNDPKHRPQIIDQPSTTVRKEWCRRPQEAYLADGKKIRRMSVAEIAAIQGFPEDWVAVDGITTNERIAVLGNAVPPPISRLFAKLISENFSFENQTLIEICAGIGGLSSGFTFLTPIAKIELWDVAATILRYNKPWPSECVIEGKAQDFDYSKYKNKVGLLCGGPPCQPWSLSGKQKGANDPRDVMGFTPTAIAECEPEMFLFENVPGLLLVKEHATYVEDLFKRMSNPKDGLRYGLANIVINAADYGVPQLRKRVFMLGIKGKSNIFVKKILNKLIKMESHHDPNKPAIGKLPWVTLREAFSNIPVTEPWRQWNATPETLARLGISE